MSATLEAFGNIYPLPLDLVPKSKVLEKALGAGMRETQGAIFELNLDPSFKPAFEWIYQRLIERTPWFENRPFPVQNWIDIFQLADYLEMEDPILEMRAYALSGKIPQDELIRWYPRIDRNLAFKNAVIFLIVENNRFYADLPTWAQEYLDNNQDQAFPTDTTFLTKLIPIQNPQLYPPLYETANYLPGYHRECQFKLQPFGVNPDALHQLQSWQTLATQALQGRAGILTCPEQHTPYIGNTQNGPCCFSVPQNPVAGQVPGLNFDRIDPVLFQGKVSYTTPAGFIVYLPSTFRGDYIFSNRFHSYPELNIVVPY